MVQLHLGKHAYRITKAILENTNKENSRIVRHFIEKCNGDGFNNLRFTTVDCLNNVDSLTADEIDDLVLKKEKVLDREMSHAI